MRVSPRINRSFTVFSHRMPLSGKIGINACKRNKMQQTNAGAGMASDLVLSRGYFADNGDSRAGSITLWSCDPILFFRIYAAMKNSLFRRRLPARFHRFGKKKKRKRKRKKKTPPGRPRIVRFDVLRWQRLNVKSCATARTARTASFMRWRRDAGCHVDCINNIVLTKKY